MFCTEQFSRESILLKFILHSHEVLANFILSTGSICPVFRRLHISDHDYYPFFFHRQILKVTEDDTSLGILPFFHIYGMCPVMMGVLVDGGKLVTLPKFDPEMFLKALDSQKVAIRFKK